MNPIAALDGSKTYLTALGLLCLGVYQISTGDIPTGIQSILAGLAAASLKSAIVKGPSPPPSPPPLRSPVYTKPTVGPM